MPRHEAVTARVRQGGIHSSTELGRHPERQAGQAAKRRAACTQGHLRSPRFYCLPFELPTEATREGLPPE